MCWIFLCMWAIPGHFIVIFVLCILFCILCICSFIIQNCYFKKCGGKKVFASRRAWMKRGTFSPAFCSWRTVYKVAIQEVRFDSRELNVQVWFVASNYPFRPQIFMLEYLIHLQVLILMRKRIENVRGAAWARHFQRRGPQRNSHQLHGASESHRPVSGNVTAT